MSLPALVRVILLLVLIVIGGGGGGSVVPAAASLGHSGSSAHIRPIGSDSPTPRSPYSGYSVQKHVMWQGI
ncbi:hypothetical protein BS78_08G158900 [Paspalum vaginatum]|nr:hypothetical protein BS78_08G158900 [Paspalum vaginatum]